LFGEVLALCAKAGLVRPGVVSIDGTRVAGNCSPEANVQFERIAEEILAETRANDEAEDEEFGDARGDELPEELRTPEGRRGFLRQARQELEGGDADGELLGDGAQEEREREYEFDAERIVPRIQGREGWSREAKRQLEQPRWENPEAVSRSRAGRLLSAAERVEDDLGAERAGNEAYEAYRERGRMKDGRRFGRPPNPYRPPGVPEGKVNITDPDSKSIPVGFGFVQGYNAQAAVNELQIVLAAEITNSSTDFSQLAPMVAATVSELEKAGVDQRPETVVADAGY